MCKLTGEKRAASVGRGRGLLKKRPRHFKRRVSAKRGLLGRAGHRGTYPPGCQAEITGGNALGTLASAAPT